jgi:dihydroxyacetone kinase
MLAKRGRAAYTGERSIGTLDAGAVAVAVLLEALADQWT